MNNEHLDNALVHQKNQLIEWINTGSFLRIADAIQLLRWNHELWVAAGYGYKALELFDRIREVMKGNDKHWQTRMKVANLLLKVNELEKLYREPIAA